MDTKVIAVDIYGTVLCSDDPENSMPPRRGFKAFAENYRSLGVKIITCSDNDLVLTQIDLEESRLSLSLFDHFFQMARGVPKSFEVILQYYKISPEQLLVIGDSFERDINLARSIGCQAILVPEYGSTPSNWDFSNIVVT